MITSASNPKIKNIRALIAKHKERRASGCFVAEGIKIIKEAPPDLVKEIYVSESFAAQFADSEKMAEYLAGCLIYETVADSLFKSISDTKEPQGVLAVLSQPSYGIGDLLKSEAPFIVVLEDVQDPGNVGTIIRTAEGAGADGIVLSSGCADVFSPKTVRSTMGSLFRVPFIITDDPGGIVDGFREKGIRTYAAMPGASEEYDRPEYRGGTALLIGNEGNGLSPGLAAKADICVKIPMNGKLESLNAAIAAAILMYEIRSKRN